MKKLFTNDKFFLSMVAIGVIGAVLHATLQFVLLPEISSYCIPVLIGALCDVFLYTSYKKHSKNVMKGLMGALLMGQLLDAVTSLSEMEIAVDRICTPLYAALVAMLFINHFIINSDHHSNPARIRVNQVIIVLLAVLEIIWNGVWAIRTVGTLAMISQLAGLVAFPCMMAVVVCVESRLDAYRLDREATGWTEEKGYPENYVHEYEKK